MDRASLAFCVAALFASVAVSYAGFALFAMPRETIVAARTPTPAERLGEIDVGAGFGKVPVLGLVGFYLENPPAAPASGAAPAKARRFGGC
jgi:hypothetical protein